MNKFRTLALIVLLFVILVLISSTKYNEFSNWKSISSLFDSKFIHTVRIDPFNQNFIISIGEKFYYTNPTETNIDEEIFIWNQDPTLSNVRNVAFSRFLIFISNDRLTNPISSELHFSIKSNSLDWKKIFDGNNYNVKIESIEVSPNNSKEIILGTNNGIFFSVDLGDNWELKNNGLGENTIVKDICISSSNSNNIFIGTNNGVYFSSNKCNSWEIISDPFGVNDIELDEKNNFLYTCTLTRGIYRYKINENLWEEISSGLIINQNYPNITGLKIDKKSYNKIYAATEIGCFYSNNYGNLWKTMPTIFTINRQIVPCFSVDLYQKGPDLTMVATDRGVKYTYSIAPNDLEIIPLQNKKVKLKWKKIDPNKQSPLATLKYNIYRTTESGSSYSLIGESISEEYIDENIEDLNTYYYSVTGVLSFENETIETGFSNEVQVSLLLKMPSPPSDISTNVGFETTYLSTRKFVKINWNRPSFNENILGYNLFRSTGLNDNYELINKVLILQEEFIDRNLNVDKVYYYKLVTIDKNGTQSLPSERFDENGLFFDKLLCDIDGSGRVDGNDFIYLMQAFWTTNKDILWNQDADFNKDNIINEKDVYIFDKYFGKSM